jgi:glycosyltransferase involved in cell wall biosynthesis
MKKIYFFTPSLNIGGIEKVFVTYAKGLVESGYEVSYLVSHNTGVLMDDFPIGVKLEIIGGGGLKSSIIPLYKFLYQNKPDIVITGGDVSNILMLTILNLFKNNTKIFISHHNYFNIEGNRFLSKIFIKYFYKYATSTISVSDGITQFLVSQGLAYDRITTIYNPIDIIKLNSLSKEESNIDLPLKFLVFVGRLGKVKNIEMLLNSFMQLIENDEKINLLIIGEGEEKESLLNLTEKLDIRERVSFLGSLVNPFPILKQSSAVVLSSLSEALPTIILESFVFSKTVVSTPTNGAMDLLENGKLGYLSESFEETEYTKVLNRALRNPIPECILQEKAKKFELTVKINELIELIEK